LSGLKIPAIKLIRLVFPLPVGPNITMTSLFTVRFRGPNTNFPKFFLILTSSNTILDYQPNFRTHCLLININIVKATSAIIMTSMIPATEFLIPPIALSSKI
jgi:hypothetical protein